MLPLVTITLVLIALLLVLRFVQPQFIYSVRRGLVKVAFNKAVIDKWAGRDNVDAAYIQALLSEAQLENQTYDEIEQLEVRIVKIRELYRLLDSRRKLNSSLKPQDCIAELGALLINLGRDLEANPEHNAPVVKSGAVLTHIADSVRISRNEDPLDGEESIDRWLIENPISIEQAIELLIAAAVAIGHRRQAVRSPMAEVTVPQRLDRRLEIRNLEKSLRIFVRDRLQHKYKTEFAVKVHMQESLGEQSYNSSVARMEEVRRKRPGLALDFFDFLNLVQLEKLILAEWDVFQAIFEDQSWLTRRIEEIDASRIGEAESHSPVGNEKTRRVVENYCRDIRKRIEDQVGQAFPVARRTAAASKTARKGPAHNASDDNDRSDS